MTSNAPKQINAAMPFRFRFEGKKTRVPASTTPNPSALCIEAACVNSVKIESVKFAVAPPESAMIEGTKAHVALAGRLLQARLTLPEYPATGVIFSAKVAVFPAVTVLLMLPPVWVPTRNGDCGEVPERLNCWDGKPELFPIASVVAVVPVDAGLKATLNVQEAPGLSDAPQVEMSGKMGS